MKSWAQAAACEARREHAGCRRRPGHSRQRRCASGMKRKRYNVARRCVRRVSRRGDEEMKGSNSLAVIVLGIIDVFGRRRRHMVASPSRRRAFGGDPASGGR